MRVRLMFGLLLLLIVLVLPVKAQLGEDERLLVWVAPVSDPFARRNSDQMGDIGFVGRGENNFESIQAVPPDTNRLAACGANAISPDGKHFAFIVGNDKSPRGVELYLLTEGNLPRKVTDLQAVGCLGANGRFEYSPDSRRLGYITYPANWSDSSYALGDLFIQQTNDLKEAFSTSGGGVISFDLTDEGAAYLRLTQNARDEAVQADVTLWRGDQTDILLTISAAQNCRYISGFILDGGASLWVGLAERCSQTEWQLFRVDVAGENAVLALTSQARGSFSGGAQTHNLFFAPDEKRLFYTLPSGRTQNSVDLYQLALTDTRAPQPVIEDDAMMLDYSGGQDAPPAISPDGRWMAFVTREGNSSAVQVLDLTSADSPPSVIPASTSASHAVSWLAFTSDSRQVVYIAGADKLSGNTLYRAEVGSSTAETIAAGTFSQWGVISPHNDQVAILEWQPTPDDRPAISPYVNLVLVDLEDGQRTLLYDGLAIDGENQGTVRFAMPLLWLR